MSIDAYQEREKREDYRAGVIAAITINANRDPKKGRTVEPADVFPSLKPVKRDQSPEQMRNRVLSLVAMSGGQVKRLPREQYEAMTSGRR